jgi:hypothetical protein
MFLVSFRFASISFRLVYPDLRLKSQVRDYLFPRICPLRTSFDPFLLPRNHTPDRLDNQRKDANRNRELTFSRSKLKSSIPPDVRVLYCLCYSDYQNEDVRCELDCLEW